MQQRLTPCHAEQAVADMREKIHENNYEFRRVYRLGFFAVAILLAIFFIKHFTFMKINPIVYFYTLGVTVFELSRVTGAYFYGGRPGRGEYEPAISFVIPVKNEEKVIAETIRRCYDVNYPKSKLEVVIVNDGSTDNTWREIEKMKAVHPDLIAVNWEKNRGKRHAMNEAIRRSRGEIIIQLDSDSFVERDSVVQLIEPFRDPKMGAVSAHTDPLNRDENMLTRMQQAYYFTSFRTLKAAESLFDMVFCCSGCCSAYRKSAIMPLLAPWTNETFMSRPVLWGDDRSLTNMVLKSGYKTTYAADVQAYTIVPDNFGQFLRQQVRWKKSWFVNSLKAAKFVFMRDWFVALTYFFPMMIITLLTPFVTFKALVLDPLLFGISPAFYIVGVFSVSALLAVNYRFFRNDKYWKYMFVWTFLSMTVLPYVLLYALADLKSTTKWGTR